jgi:hypothetical protein
MNILPDIEIQLTRNVSKFEREMTIRRQMSPSRRRYLSSSQLTTQVESREMSETREMRKTRGMRETRGIREINDEMKMIEKTDENQFRNNPDNISTEDEN